MMDYIYRIVPFYRNWSGQVVGLHELTSYDEMRSVWDLNMKRHREVCAATMLEI